MDIKVTVADASVDDLVAVAYDHAEDEVAGVTFGDVIVKALLDRLTADPRWGDLAQRFADAADEWLAASAPVFIEELVAREVPRQLADPSPHAMVRGERSTRAEAIVATEVTTQLRAQFAPLVERALGNLSHDLQVISGDAVAAFRQAGPK